MSSYVITGASRGWETEFPFSLVYAGAAGLLGSLR
jgi:hypothetical protein